MSSHLKGFPEIVNQSRSLPGAAPVKHSATVRRGHVSACESHVPGQAEIAPACRLPETTACKQRQPYREKQGEGLGETSAHGHWGASLLLASLRSAPATSLVASSLPQMDQLLLLVCPLVYGAR